VTRPSPYLAQHLSLPQDFIMLCKFY